MRAKTMTMFAWFILMGSLPAFAAEWQFVSNDSFSRIYVDARSVKSLPNGVLTLRALTDYDPNSAKAEGFGLREKGLSEIEAVSLDCRNEKYKSEGGNWFKDHMGQGAISKSYEPKQDWSKIPEYYGKLATKVCSDSPVEKRVQ
jgi:hypothetical protein